METINKIILEGQEVEEYNLLQESFEEAVNEKVSKSIYDKKLFFIFGLIGIVCSIATLVILFFGGYSLCY